MKPDPFPTAIQTAMKSDKLLKISGIFLAICGFGLFCTGLALQIIAAKAGYTGNVMTGTYEFDAPRELVVITTSLPVIAEYGDTETVKIAYTGELPLIFSEDKGLLRITQDDRFTMTLFSPRAAESCIRITLPHKVYERISLSSSSGSVSADSLGADTLEFGTKSGDLTLINIDERTSVRTESGRLYAQFSTFSGDMTINAGAGDVSLVLPPESSVYLEYFTESGSFTSDYFDEKYDARYGDAAVIYNGAKHRLNVNTTSGDLLITGAS